MSVFRVILFFFIASSSREVKVVFIDGPLETGTVRSIRGKIIDETDSSITIERSNGRLTIGRNFIIKIEDWKANRREFQY